MKVQPKSMTTEGAVLVLFIQLGSVEGNTIDMTFKQTVKIAPFISRPVTEPSCL